MKTKSRLGRGINALIPTSDESTVTMHSPESVQEIEMAMIEPNPFQPRLSFDENALNELKASIKEKGIIQAIIVRPVKNDKFQIVAGERRFRAAMELGMKTVPCHIKEISSDEEMLEIALIENIQREHLNPVDLANGYQRLIDECKMTQEDIAKKIGKDRTTITNSIRLLKLPGRIQESLRRGEIREGHARALLGVPETEIQEIIWKKAVKDSLSVRKVEQLVKKYQEQPPPTNQTAKSRKSAFISRLESRLREKLGTQVKIRSRREGGSIEISYYSPEDLERLMDLFNQIKF